MIILALSATLRGEAPLPRPVPPPVVLVRNSRREPLLTPRSSPPSRRWTRTWCRWWRRMVWDHDDDALQSGFWARPTWCWRPPGDDVIAGCRPAGASLPASPASTPTGTR